MPTRAYSTPLPKSSLPPARRGDSQAHAQHRANELKALETRLKDAGNRALERGHRKRAAAYFRQSVAAKEAGERWEEKGKSGKLKRIMEWMMMGRVGYGITHVIERMWKWMRGDTLRREDLRRCIQGRDDDRDVPEHWVRRIAKRELGRKTTPIPNAGSE